MTPSPQLMLNEAQEQVFESIASDLIQQGYSIQHSALPLSLCSGLLYRISSMNEQDFHRAGTGRQQDHQLNTFVRRDRIHWLSSENTYEQAWLDYAGELQRYLNRRLFLGLFSYECHFAQYRPGDFYKKHMDAFQGQANRILTTVLYLNPDWETQHKGELVIYDPQQQEQELLRVMPRFGTLVTFLSEEFPHEVLPAERERYSIAGWFRLNSSNSLQPDPPA
ncbi:MULTISPECIES: 2OG-Fe(II) oxygenase [unclassified Thalassolituus]|uniref:2OG-Fe(II) oxygenase n=1 Tax=unclassified Thalassolituus TaxID=2624967 RepID=UPI0025F39EF9|nr:MULTISPECIES: 2OG-Fe(II) oxygenase [unclassified Thalassolituus]